MFKNMFNKVKSFFSEKDLDKQKAIKSGINKKFSDSELKKIFKKNTDLSEKVVLFFDNKMIYQAFQVAKALKFQHILFYNFETGNEAIEQYSKATNIEVSFGDNINSDKVLLAVDQETNFNESDWNKIYFVSDFQDLEKHENDYVFLQPSINNIESFAEKINNLKYNIVGVSTSCSVFDYKNINSLLQFLKKEPFEKYKINEMELMEKMKSGFLNFYDVHFMLIKTVEISKSSLSSMLGIKWTKELDDSIKKNLTIINAMSHNEKIEKIKLDESRISRIARGSNSTIEQVETLIKMLDMFKKNSDQIAQNAGNPANLMKILGGMKN